MSVDLVNSTRSISVERVVWYSDAVVGIMQTFLAGLLVEQLADLAIESREGVASPDGVVATWIGQQGSRFLIHIIVFFMLIYLWRRHHELYRHITRLNRGMLWINSAFLCTVCIVPFATSLVARSQFTAISLAVLFATMALALWTQFALIRYARRSDMTADDGVGLTAIEIFIGLPAAIMTAATLVALLLSYFNVVGSAVIASALVLALAVVRPTLTRYLRLNPAEQPPEALAVPQDRKHRVRDMPLSPVARFFAGSSPDRSLLFSDSVYAIALTLMSIQLVGADASTLTGDEVANRVATTFTFDFTTRECLDIRHHLRHRASSMAATRSNISVRGDNPRAHSVAELGAPIHCHHAAAAVRFGGGRAGSCPDSMVAY